MVSSCEDFDDAVASRRNHEPAVLAPDNAADTFAAHDTVRGEFLCAYAFVQGPKPDGGVMPSRDCFATVFAEG